MDVRRIEHPVIRRAAAGLRNLNSRHPWSHNDHFHRWILRHLPARRDRAIDIGCGQGVLVSLLAVHFTEVHGTDTDPGMRTEAVRRCADLSNVTIDGALLDELSGPVDLIAMIAVLHHLDVETALTEVARLLSPGGRFLGVGLAAPASVRDPDLSFDELRTVVDRIMPGARMRHRLAFRHTIAWTKPA